MKRVYENADVCIDIPGLFFFEEILDAFPDCKVILMVREEDSWVHSLSYHFESLYAARSKVAMLLSPTAKKMSYVVKSFLNAAIGSSPSNYKSTYVLRKRYRIHNYRVKSIVPTDKLLVYNVKEEWKPYCVISWSARSLLLPSRMKISNLRLFAHFPRLGMASR